jgi:Protein of unknown function (DUF2867)
MRSTRFKHTGPGERKFCNVITPGSDRATQSYRIDEIAKDFQFEGVWEMPITGMECQFHEFMTLLRRASGRPNSATLSKNDSRLANWIFVFRSWLGRVFRWDRQFNELPIPGCTEKSLRDRIPPTDRAELYPQSSSLFPLRPVYQDQREAALELSNRSVHAVLHYAWVPNGDLFRAHMALYVKTRGWFGRVYLAATAPVRKYIVYPLIMKQLEKHWRTHRVVNN